MMLGRYYNFIIVFVLLMIFAAEYPKWSEIMGIIILGYIILFIAEIATHLLDTLNRIIIFDRKGVRIEERKPR